MTRAVRARGGYPGPMSPDPVLILVPGASGAPGDGSALFHVAEEDAPQLSVTDLAATRGDGVFETIGVFDGAPVNRGPHLDRLARSAGLVDLPELDLDTISAAVDAAIDAHEPVPELTVRVIVTRGIEGADTPTCWVHARVAADWSRYRDGMKVVTLDGGLASTVVDTSPWLLPGVKTTSYAVNMAATREAVRRGADDVLFVSTDGYALEGPTSTLLVRHGDFFTTTPASAGVLPGTSVATIFAALEQDGLTTREELLQPAQVAESDGAWLLSSSRLAAPLTHLDDQPIPVDAQLTRRFLDLLSGRA